MSDQGPSDPERLPPTHQPFGQQPPPPPAYPQYSPYGPPQPQAYGYGEPVLPDHPQANTAFVLGLVSLVGGFVCGLPIVVGPFAWAMGARSLREIDAAPGTYGGRDKAKAGMIMGIVATAFLALALMVVVIAVIVIVAAGASTAAIFDAILSS